jgi:hypothetical protein
MFTGADFLAALDANYFLGALAPVDFLAVYLVLAIVILWVKINLKIKNKFRKFLEKKLIIIF